MADQLTLPQLTPNDLARLAGPESGQPAIDEKALIAQVTTEAKQWRELRRPHEVQWFLTAAFIRGLQWVTWNDALQKLEVRDAPKHRIRLTVNRILPKFKARQAKFLKQRPAPYVVPASTDIEDRLDARATKAALEYAMRKTSWEQKYRQVLNWAGVAGKGFWAVWYDPSLKGRFQVKGLTGTRVENRAEGDVALDVVSPFEILVPDLGCAQIQEQKKVIRVKLRTLDELRQIYGDKASGLKPDASVSDLFQYQRQIASLNNKGTTGLMSGLADGESKKDRTHITTFEWFEAPTGQYPEGRYAVVAGDVLLKYDTALPYEYGVTSNPYPFVEFADQELPGQFWPSTLIEQTIGLQKEYNLVRSKVSENFRLMAHPKVIVSVQSMWPKGAWTAEPGEVVKILTPPGVPPPQVIQPQNIANDAWNAISLIKGEFDEVTNIFPAMQGNVGGAESGFQTNLLQEAADSIHAPDIRLHEIGFEESFRKLRHLMKRAYTQPRLIAITGRNLMPDVVEFSAAAIDEDAEIIVYTGSALSASPTMRAQQTMEMAKSGLFGDVAGNPNDRRKALKQIDPAGMGELLEEENRDEELQRFENALMEKGQPAPPPKPWDNHDIHWATISDKMKSVEFMTMPPEVQRNFYTHAVMHAKFIDPAKALQLAFELGLQELIPILQPLVPQAPPAGAPAPTGPQAPPAPAPAPAAPPAQ